MEEIECLKYLYTNLDIQRKNISLMIDELKLKDELYYFLLNEKNMYYRFMLSIYSMISNRTKKNKEIVINNNVVNTINGIQEKLLKLNSKEDYLNYIREATKINILDLENLNERYNIKSKTITNLISRITKFEKHNLEIL